MGKAQPTLFHRAMWGCLVATAGFKMKEQCILLRVEMGTACSLLYRHQDSHSLGEEITAPKDKVWLLSHAFFTAVPIFPIYAQCNQDKAWPFMHHLQVPNYQISLNLPGKYVPAEVKKKTCGPYCLLLIPEVLMCDNDYFNCEDWWKYQMVAKNCPISLQCQVKLAEPTLVEKTFSSLL